MAGAALGTEIVGVTLVAIDGSIAGTIDCTAWGAIGSGGTQRGARALVDTLVGDSLDAAAARDVARVEAEVGGNGGGPAGAADARDAAVDEADAVECASVDGNRGVGRGTVGAFTAAAAEGEDGVGRRAGDGDD